jgi:hypothetical protein
VFVVELDLGHLQNAAPLRLVLQTLFKGAARVLLGDEQLDRLRVVRLGERVRAHVRRLPSRSFGQTSGRFGLGPRGLPLLLLQPACSGYADERT